MSKSTVTKRTTTEETINELCSKLDSAISAKSALKTQLSTQSVLLTNFISKLSRVCKGIDKTLDDKLASLRTSFVNTTSLSALSPEILKISFLLQQHIEKNQKSTDKIQKQLKASALQLESDDRLPLVERQQAKKLAHKIQTTIESKNSLTHYVPLMSEFITFYENLLANKGNTSTLNVIESADIIADDKQLLVTEGAASKELLERFNGILNTLLMSGKHKNDINEIKSTLGNKVSHQLLMTKCLNVFDFIIDDLTQERTTAQLFLSTLSETLGSVQASVDLTIETTTDSHTKHEKLNQELNAKIVEMADDLKISNSLNDIKEDVNGKLIEIAKAFKVKTQLEEQHRQTLQEKLTSMSEQVEHLELQSVSFEKQLKEQQAKSLTDALTKLNNRAAFDEYYTEAIARFNQQPFDLIVSVVDLDDFKRINDTYGHTAGDKTLQVIANTLTKVISKDAFICRYGGEEFVLIFSDQDRISVINKLDSLRKKVAKLPFSFKNTPVSITLSIGVSLMQKHDNTHSLFERADTALYHAKKNGKNKVVFG